MYQQLQNPYMPMYNPSPIDYSMYGGDMTGGQVTIIPLNLQIKNPCRYLIMVCLLLMPIAILQ